MFTFEVKPKDIIYFGDLKELILHKNSDCGRETTANKLTCSFDHSVLPGNYVVSSIDSSLNPQIILHHENVSPESIAEKLSQIEEDELKNSKIKYSPPLAKRSRLSSEAENLLGDYRQHLFYCIDGQVRCRMCQVRGRMCRLCRRLLTSDASYLQFPEWQTSLLGKIHKAHEKVQDFGNAKSLKLAQLFFFVNDLRWLGSNFETSNVHVTLVDASTYKLEANGKLIGLIINPSNIVRRGEMRCVYFRDTNTTEDHHVRCFSWTIFDSCNCLISGAEDFLLPMEQHLHRNEYRCFYKSGQCEENDFYGVTGSTGVDRLPDSILIKILSYLPWKDRARCRRVSVRWAKASDSALAVDIKIFHALDDKIQSMGIDSLKRLIPLAANHLEKIYVSESYLDYKYFDECFSENLASIPSFHSLRYLNIDDQSLVALTLFAILDKCPNLKVMAVKKSNVKWAFDIDEPRKTYNLEKISFSCSTDSDLLAVANYFPKLTWIKLVNYKRTWLTTDGITNGALSAFVERFGDSLRHLEICQYGGTKNHQRSQDLVDVFTGIGQCRNLEYLSVSGSKVASDGFLKAVSTGCLNLTTLIMEMMEGVTNDGLHALASLTKLTRLNINYAKGGISGGVMTIALEGHLEQLLANSVSLSAACLKTCVRYCPQLRLLDGCDDVDDIEDALEIARQYGRSSHAPILVLRSTNGIWRNRRIKDIRNQIKEGKFGRRGRLVIDDTDSNDDFFEDDDFNLLYSEENWESEEEEESEDNEPNGIDSDDGHSDAY